MPSNAFCILVFPTPQCISWVWWLFSTLQKGEDSSQRSFYIFRSLSMLLIMIQWLLNITKVQLNQWTNYNEYQIYRQKLFVTTTQIHLEALLEKVSQQFAKISHWIALKHKLAGQHCTSRETRQMVPQFPLLSFSSLYKEISHSFCPQ